MGRFHLYYFDEQRQLWIPRCPWYANRVYDAFRALKLAWDIWRKPWQPRPDPAAEDYDPRADISLRTALEVAWLVWRRAVGNRERGTPASSG